WPLDNVTLHVLDRRRGLVPPGVRGELYIGGAGVARGYLGPQPTAERFVIVAAAGGERMYRTGDLVRRLPGRPLEFIGRFGRPIRLRGHRIEPGEIEAALRRDERVTDSLALVRHDPGTPARLVAYAAVHDPGELNLAIQLRRRLVEALPAYAVPSVV